MTTRFRREVGSTLVAQVAALVLNAITLALVARWLGPSGKGVQAIVTTTAQVIAAIGGLGSPGSVPYFVAAVPARTAAALRNGARMLAVSLGLAVAVLVAGRVVGLGLDGHEAVLVAVAATTFAQAYLFALLLALREVRRFNQLVVTDVVIALVASVAGQVVAPGSPDAFMAAQALGMAVASIVALRRITHVTHRLVPIALALGEQLRVAFLGFLSGVLALIATRADIFIVTALGGGLAPAGVYSVAVLATESILRVPQWVAQLLTPRVARAAATSRTTLQLFAIATTAATIASLVVVGLSSAFEALLSSLLGVGFVPVYTVMLALLPRVIFRSGTTMLAGHLAGRGYTAYHPIATGAGVAAQLGVDLILVPSLGAVGAGIGASVGALITLVIFLIGFRRLTNDRAPIRVDEAVE